MELPIMELLDILYTPLDTKDVPVVDSNDILAWLAENQNQDVRLRRDSSRVASPSLYPWNISYAKTLGVWKTDFKERFPELADYFSSAFGVEENDIKDIVFLPTKNEFEGTGFWHSDPDELGLRIYLENDDFEKDFLLMRPTIKKYNSREQVGYIPENGIDPKRFKEETYVAKLLKPRQAFFINNIRAIHAAKISKIGKKRIAIIVILKNNSISEIPPQVKSLIENSYEKYKDLAIARSD